MEPWWSRLREAMRRPREWTRVHREGDELGLRLSELPAQAMFFQVWAVSAGVSGLVHLGETPLLGLGLLGLAAVFACPATFREHALMRFGFVRLAALHAAFDTWSWNRDRIGAFVATLAMGHLRRPDDQRLAALLDRRLERCGRVTAGVVLAAGVRALVRGDRPRARRLLRLVADFDAQVRPHPARVLAVDLLAAEAAERGEPSRILRELDRPRVPRTRLGDLLRSSARRAQGFPVPDGVLRGAWLLAGRWTATRPLLSRIRGLGPRRRAVAPPAEDPLELALRSTVAVPEQATLAELAALAATWDAALAREDLAPVRESVRGQIVDLLVERLEKCPEAATDVPPVGLLREAAWRCADERHQALVWLAGELGRRSGAGRRLPLVDEVDAWCAAAEAFEAVVEVGGPGRAAGSFPAFYHPAVRHTVWLHNERKQPALANAMYRRALRFAEWADHATGRDLLARNLSCGP